MIFEIKVKIQSSRFSLFQWGPQDNLYSLMRPASQFEFESPGLKEEKSISSIHYNDFLNVKLNESIFHIMVKTFFPFLSLPILTILLFFHDVSCNFSIQLLKYFIHVECKKNKIAKERWQFFSRQHLSPSLFSFLSLSLILSLFLSLSLSLSLSLLSHTHTHLLTLFFSFLSLFLSSLRSEPLSLKYSSTCTLRLHLVCSKNY